MERKMALDDSRYSPATNIARYPSAKLVTTGDADLSLQRDSCEAETLPGAAEAFDGACTLGLRKQATYAILKRLPLSSGVVLPGRPN